jgi:hypothetical protein
VSEAKFRREHLEPQPHLEGGYRQTYVSDKLIAQPQLPPAASDMGYAMAPGFDFADLELSRRKEPICHIDCAPIEKLTRTAAIGGSSLVTRPPKQVVKSPSSTHTQGQCEKHYCERNVGAYQTI